MTFMGLALIAAATAPRVYRNPAMQVHSFEPPPGWELAPQSSYPWLLASYAHRDGGRLTLAAQRLPPRATAQTLLD